MTGAGLTVAVVEEVNELDGLTARSKIKSRVLSQVRVTAVTTSHLSPPALCSC